MTDDLVINLKPGQKVTVTAPSAVEPTPTPPDPTPVPPDPIPTPTPPNPNVANMLGVDFTKLSRTSDAYKRMLAASRNLGSVSLTDTGGAGNGELLAAAFVAAATNDTTLKARVVSVCRGALNGAHSRTLEQARNLAPIAVALDAVGDHTLDDLLKRERDYKAESQGSVVECHRKRPNNWGTASGLARVAVSAHINDTADLADATKVHKGWLGDRGAYSGFSFDDSGNWQKSKTAMVGINTKGTDKDGVLPDDQRRGGAYPNWTNENYVWQALGEAGPTQLILRAKGSPDVMTWSDAAIKRAYAAYANKGYGCSGDDGWQYALAAMHGVTIKHDGFNPGKSFGWVDWLYGVG